MEATKTQVQPKEEQDTMILAVDPSVASREEASIFSRWFQPTEEPSSREKKSSSRHSTPKSSRHSTPKSSRHSSKSVKNNQKSQVAGWGLTEMAEAQANLGNWEKAFELWEQALEKQREVFGPRHATVATTYGRRGRAYAHLQKWYPAALDLEKAAHIFREQNESKLASEALLELADAQVRMAHLDEAVTNLRTALDLQQELHGYETVARIHCLIGNVYHQQRQYQQALESFQRGIECFERAGVDRNDPRVVWATRRAADRNMMGHLFWGHARDKSL